MDISIIIVNYNSLDFIKNCIKSIENDVEKDGLDYEILLVDNNSDDGSVKFLKGKSRENSRLYLIENKSNTGFSKASNKGTLKARGHYLLFLNPDTKFLSGNFSELVRFYEERDKNGKAGVTGAKILNSDGTLQYGQRSFPTPARQFYESYFLHKIFRKNRIFGSYFLSWWDHDKAREVDWLTGSFMFIKRDYFLEAGMFDGDYFMYSEDTDLCLKLKRRNYKNYYFPDMVIEHADSGIASRDMARREAGIWKSRRLYFKKNYSTAHAVILSLLYQAGIFNRILLFLILSLFRPQSGSMKRVVSCFKAIRIYYRNL
ncbi:MAG: glycosyltransferase family 2 protein [Actinomycetota bacterium]|nr:glycosyltransferase family 2 protein [Actinomycetota bacterium]